jgi:hypothetical protein
VEMIRLILPPSPRHASTARMVVASLAYEAGFDVDGIEDLRLAVNEVVAVLTDTENSAHNGDVQDSTDDVEIEFSVGKGQMEIVLQRPAATNDIVLDELAVTILTAVVDDHEYSDGVFRLRKHVGNGD